MTGKLGSGGGAAVVDLDAIDRFLAVAAEVGRTLGAEVRSTARLDDAVRSGWIGPAPAGGALDQAGRLLAGWGDHDGDLARWVQLVRQVDREGAAGNGPGGEGAGGGVPWLDPGTDSWVVNLMGAARFSPEGIGWLRRDGPGVLGDLGGVVAELNLFHQVDLAVHDRRRLLANWARFGQGAVEAFGGLGQVGVGALAVQTPALDGLVEDHTGRRPGRELLDGLRGAGSLLVHDPDRLVEAQLGWDDLRNDPYHWFGGLTPDVLAELGSLGTAALASRGPRLAVQALDEVDDAAGTGRVIGHLDDPLPAPVHPDLALYRQGETDWAEAGPIVSHRQAPFESPESWVDDINGDGPEIWGRDVNCVDCARAVEANWRGQDAVAAPLRRPERRGASSSLIENWSGGEMVQFSLDDIEARLTELGPGSSAMVVSTWREGGAHAYNAVNDGGVVKWIDGQSASVAPWPPPYGNRVEGSIAVFVDAGGETR